MVLDRGAKTVNMSSKVPAAMVITVSALTIQIASWEENSYTSHGPFSFE